jgi:hypothetical protein
METITAKIAFYGSVDLTIDLPKSIVLTWRLGADISEEKLDSYRSAVIPEGNNALSAVFDPGARGLSSISRQQINSDLLLSWKKRIRQVFSLSTLAGHSANQRSAASFGTSTGSQQLADYINVSNSTVSPVSFENESKIRNVGIFAGIDLAYKSILFVAATGRKRMEFYITPQKITPISFPRG